MKDISAELVKLDKHNIPVIYALIVEDKHESIYESNVSTESTSKSVSSKSVYDTTSK